MRVLSVDVTPHGVDIRLADGKRAVARLPRKKCRFRAFALQPARSRPFQFFDNSSNRFLFAENKKHVNVIRGSADGKRRTIRPRKRRRNVGVNVGQHSRRDEGNPPFRAENQVNVNFGKRLRHLRGNGGRDACRTTLTALQACLCDTQIHGALPRASLCKAFSLGTMRFSIERPVPAKTTERAHKENLRNTEKTQKTRETQKNP